MRYSIFINQEMAVAFKLNLSEAAVFSLLYDAANWAKPLRMKCAGTRQEETFYFVSRNLIAEQLPILQTRNTDTIYRHLKSLAEKGLIFYQKLGRKDCIRVSENGKKWNVSKLGNKSEFEQPDDFTPLKNTDNQSVTAPENEAFSNSEINPSLTDINTKLGNKSELQENPAPNSEINPSKLGNKSESNSEINPTNKSIRIDKRITLLEGPREKIESVKENKTKKTLPAAEIFPASLRNHLDLHSAEELIWDMFEVLLKWIEKEKIFVDWETDQNFRQNFRSASRLFSLIHARDRSADPVPMLDSFLRTLPEWHRSKFSLPLIVSQFQSIVNEQNNPTSRATGQRGPVNPDKYKKEGGRGKNIVFK